MILHVPHGSRALTTHARNRILLDDFSTSCTRPTSAPPSASASTPSTPDGLRAAALSAFVPVGDIDVNTLFSGAYVPLAHYRRVAMVTALMIEIRRDVYLAEPGGAPNVDSVVRVLAELVDAATH